jgi:hypothetical protein
MQKMRTDDDDKNNMDDHDDDDDDYDDTDYDDDDDDDDRDDDDNNETGLGAEHPEAWGTLPGIPGHSKIEGPTIAPGVAAIEMPCRTQRKNCKMKPLSRTRIPVQMLL